MKRFGQWDEILKEPAPPEIFPIARAMRHHIRAIAYAAKGETASRGPRSSSACGLISYSVQSVAPRHRMDLYVQALRRDWTPPTSMSCASSMLSKPVKAGSGGAQGTP